MVIVVVMVMMTMMIMAVVVVVGFVVVLEIEVMIIWAKNIPYIEISRKIIKMGHMKYISYEPILDTSFQELPDQIFTLIIPHTFL